MLEILLFRKGLCCCFDERWMRRRRETSCCFCCPCSRDQESLDFDSFELLSSMKLV